MKIYLAGSISGQSSGDVVKYFEDTKELLAGWGYEVFHPMTAKGYLRTEIKFKASGYDFPPSTNHAIIERDRWMVTTADIIYCNLIMAKGVSIGSMMELAWAHQLGKHSIVSMQSDNIHRHAFVLEAADIVYETHKDAMEYLYQLSEGSFK